jgi:hypothetical protein
VQISVERVQLKRKLCNAGHGATLSRKSAAIRGNVAKYEEWSNYLRIWAVGYNDFNNLVMQTL